MALAVLIFLGGSALLTLLVLVLGLWGSKGGLTAMIKGQLPPQTREVDRKIHSSNTRIGGYYLVQAMMETEHVLGQVREEYLSFALDTAQVVGGKWWRPGAKKIELGSGSQITEVFDFNRPKLDVLVKALSPAYLRIGGSEADRVYYAMRIANSGLLPPSGYQSVLTREQWDAVGKFALRNNLQLVFTLNAGPGSRNPDGSWNPSNAAEFIRYTAQKGYPVALWEIGNELNAFWFIHGPGKQISPKQYHHDLKEAKALILRFMPTASFTGQGSAYWPVLGEPMGLFFGFQKEYLRRSGELIDLVTWHYYPQQSRREVVASRRAHPGRLLNPANLDEAAFWAEKLQDLRDRYAPGKPMWLGETGNAQAGGEPGISDVFIGSLWWLDQLGLMAKHGQKVVIRQTLCGSDYGMLEEDSLEPRPDYWASLLWRMLMGSEVYSARVIGENAEKLRIYVHSSRDWGDSKKHFDMLKRGVCVLLINLDSSKAAEVNFPQMGDDTGQVYAVTAPDVLGKQVCLNGVRLQLRESWEIPQIKGVNYPIGEAPLRIPPLSYIFIRLLLR